MLQKTNEKTRLAGRKNKKSTTLISMIAYHIIKKRQQFAWINVEVTNVEEECENSIKLDAQEILTILREPENKRLNHDTGNVQSKLVSGRNNICNTQK